MRDQVGKAEPLAVRGGDLGWPPKVGLPSDLLAAQAWESALACPSME